MRRLSSSSSLSSRGRDNTLLRATRSIEQRTALVSLSDCRWSRRIRSRPLPLHPSSCHVRAQTMQDADKQVMMLCLSMTVADHHLCRVLLCCRNLERFELPTLVSEALKQSSLAAAAGRGLS